MDSSAPQGLRYVDLDEASQITQLSTRQLRRAIKAKHLRAHRLGRLVRIALAELHRWVQADGAPARSHPHRTKAAD